MKGGMKLLSQLGLVLVSAALVPLCFPPFGWWPLVLPCFAFLFLATVDTTPRRAFYLGMLQGTMGYGLTLRWFFEIFSKAAFPLFVLLGVFVASACLLVNVFSKRTRSVFLVPLLAATLWTGVEFYRSELFTLRFPWATAGSALGPTFLSPILGVYGASFLVIAASAGFVRRRTVPVACVLCLCVLCLGLFRPARMEPDPKKSLAVTVVQSEECFITPYIDLTRAARKDSPDLIVWPEYALPYDVRGVKGDMTILKDLCAEMGAVLVVGTKTSVGSGDRDWHNTALTLDKNGVQGEYYKARPVHFFNDGIPGRRFEPVRTSLGAFGTPICFDCDYTEVTRQMTALGAEFFVVPTFDAIGWTATQHLQHAALFRLRAAEDARWFACAASSGVSQIIDPHGNVHASLMSMDPGVLTYRIGRSDRRTFFVRAGWLFPWLALVCTVVLLANGAVRAFVERRENPQPVRSGDRAGDE